MNFTLATDSTTF